MTTKEFNRIVEKRVASSLTLLSKKREIYSRNEDPLHNFFRAAQMRNKNPLEALQGMLDKHLVSWFDIVEDMKQGDPQGRVTPELVDEKIGDIINYFLIAEALIVKLKNLDPLQESLFYKKDTIYPKGEE
jgi:hypothetical protein